MTKNSNHVTNKIQLILLIAGMTCCCISDGFIFGQMSGMTDALRASNSTIPLTDDDISWIASTINITCVIGFLVVGILAKLLGRRTSISTLSAPLLISWIILYFVGDKILLLCTRVIVGVTFGGVAMLVSVCIVEYLDPNVRQYAFSFISSVGSQVGVTLGHVLCLLMDWRYVALIGLVPTGLSCLIPLFWTESPSWLATHGRFEESEEAFWTLHAKSEIRESELRELISHEKQKKREFLMQSNTNSAFVKFLFACKEVYYWRIIIIGVIIGAYRAAAGRILLFTLALTMIQEITGDSDILLYTIVVDGFGIFGAALSCFLVKRFPMRRLLLISGTIANILLLLVSASLYFVPNEEWYPWIKILLIACYCIIINAGPYPVLDIVLAEIHPLDIKEFSIFLIGGLGGTIQFLWIKLAGTMFDNIGYSGTFLFNSVVVFACIIYMWRYMPETKGKTLQNVELFFRTGKFDHINNERLRELL
ncbi:sugar transporter ERD6-like 6 [Pieris napi]|uniref:sugar transporter ERD6-like 6 n=1 Tax=Pieris napi TaxID=78633 RepID=UPI001FB92B78|nr:sugar transporter ERD6-like 6 [Pieris napi]